MVVGIGIDTVAINRFELFHLKPMTQLQRIYSGQEITDCLAYPTHTPQRFAARFAVREAAYKALASTWHIRPPLLEFCKQCTVTNTPDGAPVLTITWSPLLHYVGGKEPQVKMLVSITHTANIATAVVLVQQI